MNKKHNIWKILLSILAVMIILLIIFIMQKNQKFNNIIISNQDVLHSNQTKNTSTYFNSYYEFSLDYPTGLEYCLNDMCDNDGPETLFKIDGHQISKYKKSASKDLSDGIYLEILPRKNSLDMPAVDFAKRSLSLNRLFNSNNIYSSEEEVEFSGQKAYTFIAENGFEERGLKMEYQNSGLVAVNAPEFFEKAAEGHSLNIPHKIIYFDYKGMIYRIIYPIDKIAEDIVNSFKFTNWNH